MPPGPTIVGHAAPHLRGPPRTRVLFAVDRASSRIRGGHQYCTHSAAGRTRSLDVIRSPWHSPMRRSSAIQPGGVPEARFPGHGAAAAGQGAPRVLPHRFQTRCRTLFARPTAREAAPRRRGRRPRARPQPDRHRGQRDDRQDLPDPTALRAAGPRLSRTDNARRTAPATSSPRRTAATQRPRPRARRSPSHCRRSQSPGRSFRICGSACAGDPRPGSRSEAVATAARAATATSKPLSGESVQRSLICVAGLAATRLMSTFATVTTTCACDTSVHARRATWVTKSS